MAMSTSVTRRSRDSLVYCYQRDELRYAHSGMNALQICGCNALLPRSRELLLGLGEQEKERQREREREGEVPPLTSTVYLNLKFPL